jgi:hypothetical protein
MRPARRSVSFVLLTRQISVDACHLTDRHALCAPTAFGQAPCADDRPDEWPRRLPGGTLSTWAHLDYEKVSASGMTGGPAPTVGAGAAGSGAAETISG